MRGTLRNTLLDCRFTFATHVMQTELTRRHPDDTGYWLVTTQVRSHDDLFCRTEYHTSATLKRALDMISEVYAESVLANAANTSP
jgi:hypothetical protein